MSGQLVGLVNDHGPSDHNAWAVLSVIAEGLRGPLRSFGASNDYLCQRTRLGRDSVRRGIRVLVAEGWVERTPGRHTGVASIYRLRLEAFPVEAVEDVLKRGAHSSPVDEEALGERGAHSTPVGQRGVLTAQRGVLTAPPPVSVHTSVPPAAAASSSEQGALLLPFHGGRDEQEQNHHDNGSDWWAVVLADVPPAARPRSAAGRADVRTLAAAGGWTAAQLADALRSAGHNFAAMGGGGTLAAVRAVASNPAPEPPRPTGPRCHRCTLPYDACRALAAKTDDPHEFIPESADAAAPAGPTRERRNDEEPHTPRRIDPSRFAQFEPFKRARSSR
jgi:hypothetical protein